MTKTKSYSWDVPLKFYNPEVFKNDWRKVADHTRSVLMEDLVNPSDYKSIDIYIDDIKYYYDFIKYRKLVRANISQGLNPGVHTLRISAKDNLNNQKNISYDFYIK